MSQDGRERPTRDLHLWEIRGIRDVLTVLLVAGIFWLGYAMRDVTIPLLVALLLAYLFEPAIAWMARTRWIPFGRVGGVSCLLIATTVVLIAGLALVVPRVVGQAGDLIHDVQSGLVRDRLTRVVQTYVPEEYRLDAMSLIRELPGGVTPEDVKPEEATQAEDASQVAASATPGAAPVAAAASSEPPSPLRASAEGVAADALHHGGLDLLGLASRTGQVAVAVVAQAIAIGMLLFLIPFYFFFFSLWYPQVCEFFDSLIPAWERGTVVPLLKRMDAAVAGFVRGRIVIALIMAVLYAVGWAVCGVPYAILLAVVVGAFSLVPFLGLIGIPIAVGMLALANLDLPEAARMSWWGVLIWPTLVFAVVNALDGWVLTPIIAGKATNLDPVTIFVAVLAGGSVMGAYGMLIAIPIAACIKILLSDLVIPKVRELAQRPASGEL